MYSRDETVNAVLKFYQEIIRHPYLDDDALILPPPDGWESITIDNPHKKTETVLDLLHHLPYLQAKGMYDRYIIAWETVPICYVGYNFWGKGREEYLALPPHCVYLAHSVDREGTSLILNTDEGTITEYSITGGHITVIYEEFDALPEADKWKVYRTTPVTEFFEGWTQRYQKLVWMLTPSTRSGETMGTLYSRADNTPQEEELLLQERLEPWHPDKTTHEDDQEGHAEQVRHAAAVYNTYLRYGWPHNFRKEQCRSELLELERKYEEDMWQRMREMDPESE
ncbi:uncharacterized protein F4822DRAFT_277072 [Hypoxylon trugodes]|uniref:uncharacterized protein n=1 Tax=Hypoxylon trugodes TaxID=326681 RepID=UPI0021A24CCE|nr:uncharacterized protein F4822DRAFT_277072 [Hypoxylon trugodes]KAI1387235.1 hypothetical protein F4822DRAFT_277072 [Hypoxylon trugodes]